ncbi:MAG: hypothetical protein IKW77_09350 [Salinivirgaceae bacterium]|nr:hypothetical protein [Salinivirgaceae bacterium]
MKHCRIISALLLALLAMSAIAQTQDFVYILPSKEIAETGEDLWFKAYLMDRQTFALSDRSQTLYLQIRTATDSVVWSEKYPLLGGCADGHIYVGDKWPQGEYLIEGYTRSSFTTDTAQALHPRRIRVVERVAQMDAISAKAVRDDSIQKRTATHRFNLFPEGGNLIYGVNSVVAFKATYSNGFPEDVTGKVLEDGREIAEIQCQHDGMGQFMVTPQQGKEYKVVLSDGQAVPFPKIESNGLSLKLVRNNPFGITLLVSASDSVAHPFKIVAKLNGMLCSEAEGMVRGQQFVRLPKALFPIQGIAEITLLEGDRPVAERLVYVNPDARLNITATTNDERYFRRDTGTVRLQVTDSAGRPIQAELAVSIFDKAYLYQPGHENILSHSYLSEQIRGNVFNPTYYFDTQNDDRLQALDLLLLTQGWRRYVWESEPTPSRPLLTDGVSGMQITKRDINCKTQVIKTFSPNGDTCLILTDSLGGFEIDPELMQKMPGNIYLKSLLTNKYKAKLLFASPFDTINAYRLDRPQYLSQNHIFESDNGEQIVFSDDKVILLEDVVVKAKRRSVYHDKVTGYLDSLANVEGMGTEWVCIHINRDDITDTMFILNDYYSGFTAHPESNYCEGKIGKPIPGKEYTVLKVHTYIDDVGRECGVFYNMIQIVYPKRTYTDEQLLRMYGLSRAQGYNPKREFYEPDSFDRSSPSPDPRNLLQWRPAVFTNENGVAEIPFTASDVNTEFIGIVEAIDGTGQMGCQTFSFRVLKK